MYKYLETFGKHFDLTVFKVIPAVLNAEHRLSSICINI